MRRYPSIKTLMRIPRLTDYQAKQIRLWMQWSNARVAGLVENGWHGLPSEAPEDVKKWVCSCYNMPSRSERANACIAHIITDGMDTSFTVFDDQSNWKSIFDGPRWEAVNTGDAYTPTLIYRPKTGSYRVGCWGDLPEVKRSR